MKLHRCGGDNNWISIYCWPIGSGDVGSVWSIEIQDPSEGWQLPLGQTWVEPKAVSQPFDEGLLIPGGTVGEDALTERHKLELGHWSSSRGRPTRFVFCPQHLEQGLQWPHGVPQQPLQPAWPQYDQEIGRIVQKVVFIRGLPREL